jgi:hypothetical protein
MTQIKPRKQRTTFTTEQKLDYAKLMVNAQFLNTVFLVCLVQLGNHIGYWLSIANKAVAFFRVYIIPFSTPNQGNKEQLLLLSKN